MPPVFGTNWKMRNVGQREAQRYLLTLADGLARLSADGLFVFVLPPATLLPAMSEVAKGTSILLGAQNFHWEEEGEFTGELSTDLLKDAGATVLMVGHAERRTLFNENDEVINRKLRRALQCINKADLDRLIVAYEPHWAIGRQFEVAAPVGRVRQSVEAIRAALKAIVVNEDSVPVIYGGNVNLSNCQEIASVPGLMVYLLV